MVGLDEEGVNVLGENVGPCEGASVGGVGVAVVGELGSEVGSNVGAGVGKPVHGA